MARDPDDSVRAALRAAVEDYAATIDPSVIHHTVQVTSFGGSGTTAICAQLMAAGVDLQPGPAHWPFKHRRQPPTAAQVPEGYRVVYPVSDPRDAVISVFRRNLQLGHFESLRDLSPTGESLAHLSSLEAFLTARVDEFELADHLAGWEAHPAGYPVMFVRVEHLAETWDHVAEFVGLPPGSPGVPDRSRHSDWRSLEPRWRRALEHMYGDLARHIAELPPIAIIE